MLSAYVWCIIRRSVQTDFVLLVNYHLSYHCNTRRECEIPYINCTSFCCRLCQKSIRTWLWNWLMKNKKRRRRRKIKVVPIYWRMIGSRLCLRIQTLKWTKMRKNTGQYLNLWILMFICALFAICTTCSFIYEVETRLHDVLSVWTSLANDTLYFISYRLLNPVVSRLDKSRKKELKKKLIHQQFEEVEVCKYYVVFFKCALFIVLEAWIQLLYNIVS